MRPIDNNHSDVEALTGPDGTTTATYGYTAYGSPVSSLFTGQDKGSINPGPATRPYSTYRFNAMRWDSGTGQYDMGFRTYDPGANQFLTRDMYDGALASMNLTADPFTGAPYAFANGNPITNIELDGHMFPARGGPCYSSYELGCFDAALQNPPLSFGKVAAGAGGAAWDTLRSLIVTAAGAGSLAMLTTGNIGARLADRYLPPPIALTRRANPSYMLGALIFAGLTLPGGGGPDELSAAGDTGLAGRLAASCGGMSFAPGTKIILARGRAVPISALRPGMKVLATDVRTGKTRPHAVTAVLVHYDTNIYDLHVRTTRGSAAITTTSTHLFWDTSLNYWIPANHLKPGTHLRTPGGQSAVVVGGSVPAVHDGWMWDLTVPGNNDHDFYVAVVGGGTAVLVHNASTPCGVDPYQVGTYKDLKAASKPGDGLDIHHVPQGQPAGQVIPGYDYPGAPAIALPRAEHALIPNLRGVYAGTSQDLIAQDLENL